MAAFIARRIVYMLVTLVAISVMTFVIIQLPRGDFVTAMVAQLNLQGTTVGPPTAALRARYGSTTRSRPVLEVDHQHRPLRRFRLSRSNGGGRWASCSGAG